MRGTKEDRKFLSNQGIDKYQDMISLPHHVSKTHAPMPVQDRAAQFAPFQALNGHSEAVRETARLTAERLELDEACKAFLDGKLRTIRERLRLKPAVAITYFVPDAYKAGGSYVTKEGCVKKIDQYEGSLIFTDRTRIKMDDIIEIDIAKEDFSCIIRE